MTVRSIHGGKPVDTRISDDDANELRAQLERALADHDHVLVISVGAVGTDHVCSRYSAHTDSPRTPISQFFRMLYITAHELMMDGMPDK